MDLRKTIIRKFIQDLANKLLPIYPPGEATSIAWLVVESLTGLSRNKLIIKESFHLDQDMSRKLDEIISRLLKNEPVQYILGEAWFYGRKFKVDRNVLIPRTETEELVDLIINENRQNNPAVLEIGSGSGCIIVSLSLELKCRTSMATDISAHALEISELNAIKQGAKVEFRRHDILHDSPLKIGSRFDMLVSNPPYVKHSEKSAMQPNVLEYEPSTALFVDDNDPLIFYRKIISISTQLLNQGGKLYFEINETEGSEMLELMKSFKLKNCRILNDIHQKSRFAAAEVN